MRVFIALLFPPLAVLITGRPLSALLNLLWLAWLTLAFAMTSGLALLFLAPWIPGPWLHAVLVLHQEDADERHRQLMAALKAPVPAKRRDEWQLLGWVLLAALAITGLSALLAASGKALQLQVPAVLQGIAK